MLYMACHSIISMFKALLYVLILRLHGPTQTQSSHSNKNQDALVSELVVNLIPAPLKVWYCTSLGFYSVIRKKIQ